ncbi:MAG TPA: hypothetical protein VHN98_03575 [Acidimicrobiales bacterium]|nr:hypothetical protein [Acidimicrobiales bacterium]
MQTRRWINQSQPQTLVIAVMLMYFDAGFLALLGGGLFSPIGIVLIAGYVAAGYFISNERKWGYYLGLAIAVLGLLPFVLAILGGSSILGGGMAIGLLFAVAKFALLVHPMSREYVKVWFR